MQVVSLGPWAFPVAAIGLVLAVVAAEITAAMLARRGHADAGNGIWWVVVATLLGARLAYVVRFWPSYRAHPWDIIDIRDMGFGWVGAVLALVLVVALLAWRKPAWRRVLPSAVAAGLLVFVLVGVTARQLRASSHPPLPSLVLRALDGGEVPLASLSGQPMVINLWATWCPPCRREMPMLVEAQQSQTWVRFVFADQGESAAQVEQFFRSEGLAPRHALIDGTSQLARYYRAPGYPTTVFLDAEGRLQDIHVGPLSHATLHERLQRLRALVPIVDGESP